MAPIPRNTPAIAGPGSERRRPPQQVAPDLLALAIDGQRMNAVLGLAFARRVAA